MRQTIFFIPFFLLISWTPQIDRTLYAQTRAVEASAEIAEEYTWKPVTDVAPRELSPWEPSCWEPTCLGDEEAVGASDFRLFRAGSRLKFQGFVESGLYTNAHGMKSSYGPNSGPHGTGLLDNTGNGPMFGPGLRTTNYNMNQLWGSLTREIDHKNGLDWGFQTDFVYGMGAYDVQSFGDESFDYGWGKGDYGFGIFQLYGEIGYKKLTARYGKIACPLGWENVPSWDNFFSTDAYCSNIAPSTFTGAMANYQLTDDLQLIGAWTTGAETGFANRYGSQGMLAGLELGLTDKTSVYYYMIQGRQKNEDVTDTVDYFIQSLCFEWLPTEKLAYIIEYALNNANEVGGERLSAYGINNHLIYSFNDRWAVGLRGEWFRDNGVLGYEDFAGDSHHSDYFQTTLGVNYSPTENLRIRPEVRYDRAFKNPVFAGGTKNEQISGGFAMLYRF